MPVATPISRGRKPIQIRADALRNWQAPFDANRGFVLMPEDAEMDPKAGVPQPGDGWRNADLERAIAVAEKAGLRSYRIEIAPDGTISIIVGEQPQGAGDASSD